MKGLTQHELAAETGISLAILGTIERGNRKVTPRELSKIAGVLAISIEELQGQ